VDVAEHNDVLRIVNNPTYRPAASAASAAAGGGGSGEGRSVESVGKDSFNSALGKGKEEAQGGRPLSVSRGEPTAAVVAAEGEGAAGKKGPYLLTRIELSEFGADSTLTQSSAYLGGFFWVAHKRIS
jgi:hypothetical protein